MIFGIQLEHRHGTKKIIKIYLITGVGGVLLSALLADYSSVGASCSIMGLLGAIAGYLILNWAALDFPGSNRNQLTCFLIMIIMLNMTLGLQPGSMIDNYGHIGGLLTGVICGYSFLGVLQENSGNSQT